MFSEKIINKKHSLKHFKMKNNFIEWERHYHDVLTYQFEKFNIFLSSGGNDLTDYETFTQFMYTNTKKTKHPFLNKLIAPLY